MIALGDTIGKPTYRCGMYFTTASLISATDLRFRLTSLRSGIPGATSALEVRHIQDNQNILLERIPIDITSDAWFDTKEVIIEANRVGCSVTGSN